MCVAGAKLPAERGRMMRKFENMKDELKNLLYIAVGLIFTTLGYKLF